MTSLKLYFLGSPRIELSGQAAESDTRKATALLAYLTITEQPQTRDHLAALLWPEFDHKRAKAALRRTLSALKRAIGPNPLHITRESLSLNPEHFWCDVLEFQQIVDGVDVTTSETAVSQWKVAVSQLYRDDFLSGFSLRDSLPFDEWQLQQTEHLRRRLTQLLAQLVQHQQQQGNGKAALQHARRWLRLDPLREEVHQQLMQLYSWAGQRSAALQQYRNCVRILEEELGVSPLTETTDLYHAIQANTLKHPTTKTSPKTAVSPPQPIIPLIGRDDELATLHQLYKQVQPDGRLITITGEIGIGKTRLAQQFLANLPDTPTLQARCYQGESHLAYSPFIHAIRHAIRQPQAQQQLQTLPTIWLAEATRLLPELAELFPQLPINAPNDWPGAPNRFLDGLSHLLTTLLSHSNAGVLWLDDVQWADSASLDLLAYLIRRWRERPYLILICWRDGDLPSDHQLRQLLADSRRQGVGEIINLARLDKTAVTQLAQTVTTNTPSDQWLNRLYQESEGLPILLTAYLEAQAQTPDQTDWTLPATTRDLFLTRLNQTSQMGQQLLQTAAVIGRATDFDLLQNSSGRSQEEALLGLENLLEQHLLTESSTDFLYNFSHHKLRDLIYDEMSLVRRRLLHGRIAQALVSRTHNHTATTLGQIAAHFQKAGKATLAATYYQQAGDAARTLFAHREALTHYQSALALGHSETAATLHQACGDAHLRLGQYSAALASYERAAALSQAPNLAQLEHKIGQLHYRRGEWELAEHHFAQTEKEWVQTADISQNSKISSNLARLYIDWSNTAYRAGNITQARQYANQAKTYAQEPLSQAHIHNILGILARHDKDMSTASHHFEQSLTLSETHGWLSLQIAALNNLALVETAVHNHRRAQTHLQNALQHCLTYGDRHWEAALYNNLADLAHQQGDKEKAMGYLKTAVAIYAEIGQEMGQWQPEIWKLMDLN